MRKPSFLTKQLKKMNATKTPLDIRNEIAKNIKISNPRGGGGISLYVIDQARKTKSVSNLRVSLPKVTGVKGEEKKR